MPKTIDYRKAPGLNYSALKLIDKSPKHFKHFLDAGGTPDSAAYAQGRAMHSALLEPHKFNNDYIIQPPQFKMRSGKAWEAFLEANPDKTILKLDDYSSVLECARIVKEDPIAKKFFTKKFKFEHSIFWEYRGIACKSQLDISGPNLADYKSSIDVKPSEFCKSSWRYGYHVQFAFYQMAFEAETGERRPFFCIAQEKKAPHDVVVFECDEDLLALGRKQIDLYFDRYIDCMSSDKWPGQSEEILKMSKPSWVIDELEELVYG